MKVKLQTAVVVLIVLLGATGTLWASQAVRVVSDLEGTTPGFSVSRAGSSGERLELSVPAIAINPISLNGNEYKQVGLPATDYLLQSEAGQDGEPDVPSLTSMLIIPDQAGIQLDISYSSYDIIDNIDLAPVQPSPSDTDPNAVIPFTMNESIYQTDAFYPEQLASAADPIIMRDVRAVQIQINPVQYNPVRHQLRVYRDLTVNVNYAGEVVNPKLTGTSYLSDGFYPLYKSTFANFEEFFSNTEIKRGGYMIICKPTLADSLKALAAWKHQKGYTVRIVKTTDIIPSGSPNYTQVFNYIKTAYQTWTVPPEYVMIVGDIDGTFGIPCYTYQSYPSDHHYACVDGTDFIPDIFVARLSVDAIADFRKAVSKIFKYEKTPLMRDTQHWIRGLAVGYTMFPTARYTTLWARQLAMRHGFARVDTIYGSSDNPNLNTYMNNGPGLIWYRGEGNQDGWWGVSYDIADLNAMPNNQKLGVMSPLTCGLGDFSANDCFGETWIRMGLSVDSLKGGPAFYGVTDHFTHTKWNNPIMTGYFFGMFEQNCYHFGQAAIAGKMQDYRTFPRNLNSEVQQYFNTYNMQGDPELEIRQAVPVLINVVHPDTLGFGLNHIEISVADTMGQAIKDAIVTLVKSIDSTEEVFSVGQTDENGNVSLSFRALTTGSMILTVSGRDLYPYQSLVEIVSSDIAVGYDSLYIDDDSIGFSRGNSDGFAGPAEIIELGVAVRNFGDSLAADSIIGVLTPIDEGVVDVFDGTRYYNDLAPGESRMDSRPYVIDINSSTSDGDLIRLKQSITDQNNDSWYSVIEIPIKAPKFVISQVAIIDTNNRVDPGDTVQMVLTLINKGHVAASEVTAQISTEDDYTTISSASGSFGDMPVDDTSSNTLSPMRFWVDTGVIPGSKVRFNLNITTASGAKSIVPFYVTVDSVLHTNDPTGPDDYGYYIYDKNDTLYSQHPHYSWVETVPGLGGLGTRLVFSSLDDKSVLITLPFDFVYYGNIYRNMIVCTNGFISPDTSRFDMGGNYWANFFNWPIPDPGPTRGQISPFWDDLTISSTGNYGIFTWSDTTNHRYVIEWNHATNNYNSSSVETFEVIICDPAYYPTITGDAEMIFQYATVYNIDTDQNYVTVGCENFSETMGIQYAYDNFYSPGASTLAANMALKITTNTGRGGLKGSVELTGAGGHNGGVVVSSSSGQKRTTGDDGEFWLRNLPLGTVSLSVQADGYFPAYVDSVEVVANQAAILPRIGLDPCPSPESLLASDNLAGVVHVGWRAVSNPRLIGYNVYRSRFATGGFARLNSTPIAGTSYSDNSVPDSSIYFYYATALYSDSIWSGESFPSGVDSGRILATGIAGENSLLPSAFFLSQNYPNPFNPTTVISYGLPEDANVRIDIYNVIGQKVLTLLNERQKAGYKSVVWTGKDASGKSVASGVYFYRIDTGSKQDSKKMLLLK